MQVSELWRFTGNKPQNMFKHTSFQIFQSTQILDQEVEATEVQLPVEDPGLAYVSTDGHTSLRKRPLFLMTSERKMGTVSRQKSKNFGHCLKAHRSISVSDTAAIKPSIYQWKTKTLRSFCRWSYVCSLVRNPSSIQTVHLENTLSECCKVFQHCFESILGSWYDIDVVCLGIPPSQ